MWFKNDCLLLIHLLSFLILINNIEATDDMYQLINLSPKEIIESKGFKAEDHYVVTSGGYVLNVVRATNPLINRGESGLSNKQVILFVHGTLNNAKAFLVNSFNIRPKDFTNIDVKSKSLDELQELLNGEPSTSSMFFLALNFGHEVWVLNRRGTMYSQKQVSPDRQPYSNPITNIVATFQGGGTGGPREFSHVNENTSYVKMNNNISNIFDKELSMLLERNETSAAATISNNNFNKFSNVMMNRENDIMGEFWSLFKPSFNFDLTFDALKNTYNPRYWDFSMDEQAKYDIPEVTDYILRKTGRPKLAYIGHSVGGALPLMALAVNQSLNTKFSKTILWAPALELGANTGMSSLEMMAYLFLPAIMAYVGGLPPTITLPLFTNIPALICSNFITQYTICLAAISLAYGPSDHQQLVFGGQFAYTDTSSSHELAQLGQFTQTIKSCYYNFGTAKKNLHKYNQPYPPCYNFSDISTNTISIWNGETDALVEPGAIDLLLKQFTVPVERHYLKLPLYFDHMSFFFHKQVGEVLNIPSLKTLES